MKISVLSRSASSVAKERKQDMPAMHVNADPAMHPFARPRELIRA